MKSMTKCFPFAAIAGLMLVTGVPARAQTEIGACIEDPRRVIFSQPERTSGDPRATPGETFHTVRLRSLVCRVGPGDQRVRIEFHRLSDTAAGLLGRRPTAQAIDKIFGDHRVVETEAWRTFKDLHQRFGGMQAIDDLWTVNSSIQGLDSPRASGTISDQSSNGTYFSDNRFINRAMSFRLGGFDYPSLTERRALAAKNIPTGLRFIFKCYRDPVLIDIPALIASSVCKSQSEAYGGADRHAVVSFWRWLEKSDINEYRDRVIRINREISLHNRFLTRQQEVFRERDFDIELPETFEFLNYLVGDQQIPAGLIMIGFERRLVGCDLEWTEPQSSRGFLAGWQARVSGLPVSVDLVSIQNLSRTALDQNAARVRQSTTASLRPAGFADLTAGALADIELPSNLAPGARLLFPTRLVIPGGSRGFDLNQATSQRIFAEVGAGRFSGATSNHEVPRFREFVFGRETAVAALTIGGKVINLTDRRANGIDISVGAEAGSCPFLVSYDLATGEALQHGKVLHRAPDASLEYTERVPIERFRSRFRIEEREEELAFLDHAELEIRLRSGETRVLASSHPLLGVRDRSYLELYWGDGVDLNFALPEDVAEADVVSSEFRITGYYRRYAALQTAEAPVTRPLPGALQSAAPLVCRPR